jgi:hypothetical protein
LSYSHLQVFGYISYKHGQHLVYSWDIHHVEDINVTSYLAARYLIPDMFIFEENTVLFANFNILTTVGYNFLDNDTPFLPSYTYTTPTQNNLTPTSPPNPTFLPHSNSPSSSNNI